MTEKHSMALLLLLLLLWPQLNHKRSNNEWLSAFTVSGRNLKCKFCQNFQLFSGISLFSVWAAKELFVMKKTKLNENHKKTTRFLVWTFVCHISVYNWIIKWFQLAFGMHFDFDKPQVANNLIFVILFVVFINIVWFVIHSNSFLFCIFEKWKTNTTAKLIIIT